MEIILQKRLDGETKSETIALSILDYKILTNNCDLLLVHEGEITLDGKGKSEVAEHLEIFKIQFIAKCKTKLNDQMVIAFFVGEYFSLQAAILSELPRNHYHYGGQYLLVDYKSYSSICELTNEVKLSLADYIKELKKEHILNNLVKINGKYLNSRDSEFE